METITQPEINIDEIRTDKFLFNVDYLDNNRRADGSFHPYANDQVLQQNISEIGESDIHGLSVPVHQIFNEELGQYYSLGDGTLNNNIRGRQALGDNKNPNLTFEGERRDVEIVEEERPLYPATRSAMMSGGMIAMISPSPTHHEADVETAIALGYDTRTMIRVQTMNEDGEIKTMHSSMIFDVDADVWASVMKDVHGVDVPPVALEVMKACNDLDVVKDMSPAEYVSTLIRSAMKYVDDETQDKLQEQLDVLTNVQEQERLSKIALYYAKEKLEFEQELANSKLMMTDEVADFLDHHYPKLHEDDKALIDRYRTEKGLRASEDLKILALQLKVVTLYNRAGIAAGNKNTLMKATREMGVEGVANLAQQEAQIRRRHEQGEIDQNMIRRSEGTIADANLDCGGGCAVAVSDKFKSPWANKVGLGEGGEDVYQPEDGQCVSCKKVGSVMYSKKKKQPPSKNDSSSKPKSSSKWDKLCTSCGAYEKGNERGNIKQITNQSNKEDDNEK